MARRRERGTRWIPWDCLAAVRRVSGDSSRGAASGSSAAAMSRLAAARSRGPRVTDTGFREVSQATAKAV
jgi:hypothetical protein